MPYSKAQGKATQKWLKEKTIQKVFRFNVETEKDVINQIEKQENKRQYIIKLVRDDIEKENAAD